MICSFSYYRNRGFELFQVVILELNINTGLNKRTVQSFKNSLNQRGSP